MRATTSPLPHSKHASWFYSTKNSKMGFFLREFLSSRESCINILYILSLPIFSSYSIVPLGEVELRVTVERVGTWLRTYLWYPPTAFTVELGFVMFSPFTHPSPKKQQNRLQPVPRNSQPALKVIKSWMMCKLISLLATAFLPQRPSNRRRRHR